MQIDWISGYIEPRSEVYTGAQIWEPARFLKIDPAGELVSESPALSQVVGSHDTSMSWGSQDGRSLYYTGNPVKFLQGHNLFGSADAQALFVACGSACRQLGAPFPGIETWAAYEFDFQPTRLDVTRSYRFSTQQQALEWIYHVGASAHSGRHKKDHQNSTVYFGKKSRRWAMKIYSKLLEVTSKAKGHRLSAHLTKAQQRQLLEWSEGVVRFEITLRGMELKEIDKRLLVPNKLPEVWSRYHDRIKYNRNAEAFMSDLTADSLLPAERSTLLHWRNGVDARSILPRRTWYRHRKAILETTGVDISEPPPEKPAAVRAELDPKGWDPEPIRDLEYDPEPVAVQYSLRRWGS